MQESLRIQNDRAREMKDVLLDICDAAGDRFDKFLLDVKISPNRWSHITTLGNINLTEVKMIASTIGVGLDYFINCCVHIGHVAKRFENESYDSTQARSSFTRKILELNSNAKMLHLKDEVVTKSVEITKNTYFCHS